MILVQWDSFKCAYTIQTTGHNDEHRAQPQGPEGDCSFISCCVDDFAILITDFRGKAGDDKGAQGQRDGNAAVSAGQPALG